MTWAQAGTNRDTNRRAGDLMHLVSSGGRGPGDVANLVADGELDQSPHGGNRAGRRGRGLGRGAVDRRVVLTSDGGDSL